MYYGRLGSTKLQFLFHSQAQWRVLQLLIHWINSGCWFSPTHGLRATTFSSGNMPPQPCQNPPNQCIHLLAAATGLLQILLSWYIVVSIAVFPVTFPFVNVVGWPWERQWLVVESKQKTQLQLTQWSWSWLTSQYHVDCSISKCWHTTHYSLT